MCGDPAKFFRRDIEHGVTVERVVGVYPYSQLNRGPGELPQ